MTKHPEPFTAVGHQAAMVVAPFAAGSLLLGGTGGVVGVIVGATRSAGEWGFLTAIGTGAIGVIVELVRRQGAVNGAKATANSEMLKDLLERLKAMEMRIVESREATHTSNEALKEMIHADRERLARLEAKE